MLHQPRHVLKGVNSGNIYSTNRSEFRVTLFKCGAGYSCLKVTQPSQVFTKYGSYVAPENRRADNTVYRGCYVLDIRKV